MLIRAVVRGALRFRVLVVGAAALLIALGLVSLRQMHEDVLPELSSGPVLEVQTEALGLSSQEVEQYITVPMENNLLDGVMGVWDVRSHSTPGLSTVDLYFEPGTTTLHARQLVEERLTNAFSLPNVSKPPLLIQPLSSTSRVLMIGLRSSTVSPLELSYLARWVVKPRLSGVAGVANVSIFGQQDRQIQVQVDPARLAAQHIRLQQIIDTAGNAQLVSPLSYLEGSAPGTGGFLDEPNQRLDIRPVLPLGTPRDLATVPIAGAAGRQPLGSVARVVQSHQPLIGDALGAHGSELVLMVQKLPSASVLGVTNGLQRAIADLRPALRGVSVDTSFFRPAAYVASALDNLALALVLAGVLLLLALSRTAARRCARCSSPRCRSRSSMILAALVLQLLGYTLNALVVLGLLLASAVLVDDAAGGSAELIRSLRRRSSTDSGPPLQPLILEGTRRLRSTLGYATLIVLLSITPGVLRPRADGHLPAPAGARVRARGAHIRGGGDDPHAGAGDAPVRAAAAAPARRESHARRTTRLRARGRGGTRPPAGRSGRRLHARPGWVHRPAVAASTRAAAVQGSQPRRAVEGPGGASLPEMNRVTGRVIADLRALPARGRRGGDDRSRRERRSDRRHQLGPDLRRDQSRAPTTTAPWPSLRGGRRLRARDAEPRSRPTRARFSRACSRRDKEVTRARVRRELQPAPSAGREGRGRDGGGSGLGQPHMSLPSVQPNIEVRNRRRRRLTPPGCCREMPGGRRRRSISGLTVGNFFQNQAVFDVVVMGTPSTRASVDSVRSLLIDTGDGGHVPLSSIASVGVRADPVDIQHEALSRYVEVNVPVLSGSVAAARSWVQGKLANVGLHRGYHAEVLGGTPDTPTSHVKFLSILLAAAVGLLLLLQAALRSWRLAALVMLTLPVSLAGGVIVAAAGGQGAALGADAGLLAVLAFAIRQGLVTVAHLRRVHEADGDRVDGGDRAARRERALRRLADLGRGAGGDADPVRRHGRCGRQRDHPCCRRGDARAV